MDRSNLYNIIHLSLSFFLIFMSYNVTQTFQTSSDYAKDGAFAIGIIYLVFCLGNLALSSYITQLLGVRLTLILSSLTYVLFIACNIKYNKWTLYICAFLLGFGAALLWTAQGVYVTISTNKHEQINNLIPSSTRGFMNGIFFGLFQLHQIIGNLLVSFLFHLNFDQWIIFTIMTSIAGLGMLSLIFLRNIKLPKIKKEQSILSSLSILLDIRFILLIPAMCYNGLSQGFIFATIPPLIVDKSRKYLMFALFGTITAFNFIVVGKLSDLIGRRLFIFIIGALAHMIIFGLLLTIWKASLYESRTEIFVMLLTGLSIGDTIFSTLLYSIIASIYGETRPADAFACLRLFQSGSTAIAFVEQVYIRFSTQVLCRIIVLSLTVIILIYEHYCVISFDVGKTNMSIEKKRKKETEADMEAQIALTALTNKA
ncbi:unnamed protein product [Rotaria sp. Silwood1]|nr:unnamed protein product [Rotaria sp. Silwood1]CAF0956774.1 unnamed protein product [Rotaria sp. Silwood1]CAF3472384.1 unnamed protein product [Rotaria sp. Silwood1]CAF4850487.1 unnamed protein product [Rotaria sp. Silwood1]